MSEQHEYDGIKYREEKSSPGVFRILFTVLAVWGVIYMGYYLFSGWNSQAEADAAKKMRDSQKQAVHKAVEATGSGDAGGGHKIEAYAAAGKQLFGRLCVSCHGENAKGGVGPDLTVSKYKYGKSGPDIAKTISEGRPGGMPSFSSQLDKGQIERLVEFVLTLK